jgi:hypothetical protein
MTVAMVVLGSLAGAPTVRAATRCDRTGKTVARTKTVRIYRDGSKAGSGKMQPRYFACLRQSDAPVRRLPLVQPVSQAWIALHSFRIAGHFVAYVQRTEYPEEMDEEVWSLSVASDLARWYRTTNSFCAVTSLALNRSGSVAYIDQNVAPLADQPWASKDPFHVYRGVVNERLLLDAGDDIDPASVAIVGSEVQWMRGREARSAPL